MAIDPLTATLTAGTLVGNLLQGQEAKRTSQQALLQQLRMFNDQMRMARAGRTDVYGNRVGYDEALNEWITQLTPMQRRLMKAGEHEQLQNLLVDAVVNRQARGRATRRAQMADEDYNRELTEYRYDRPRSEAATRDEILGLIMRSRGTGDANAGRGIIRQRGNVPVILRSGSGGDARDDAASAMLEARRAALQESIMRNQARAGRVGTIGQFNALASGGGGNVAPYNPPDTNRIQESMAQIIANVGARGAKNIGNAQTGLTKATGSQFPSIGDTARLIAALRGVPSRSRVGQADAATRGIQDMTIPDPPRPSADLLDDEFFLNNFGGMR